MAKIILDNLVILKLKELGEILYEDEYFGFVEDALRICRFFKRIYLYYSKFKTQAHFIY
jgi:hypothetical protein